jgi:hypothetical protein
MTAKQPVAANEEQPKPWHAAYPASRNAASWVTRQTLLSWMKKGKVAGKDFVLVDLRRTDFEVNLLPRAILIFGCRQIFPPLRVADFTIGWYHSRVD